MTEQDLREKFIADGCLFANAEKCVQIAKDYAEQEATLFGAWFHENYQNIGIQLYRKFGSFENVTIEEAYEAFKKQRK